jgi:abequosyltransferase
MLNKSLAIVIPTYNKLDSLRLNLINLLPDLKKHSIGVYIVDDSHNYDIQEFTSEFKNIYPYIFFSKNHPRLRHDKNVIAALSKSKAEYTWILGDRVGIMEDSIEKILRLIYEQKYDIIAVNKNDRVFGIPSQFFNNANEVFNLIGWHLTSTGVTIYSSKALKKINNIDFEKFTNFPQLALIFTHLSDECSFYWLNDNIVYSLPLGNSYWINTVFAVFIDDWKIAINNLPDTYSERIKNKVIVDHSIKSNLFTFKLLFKLRSERYFNFTVLKKYRHELTVHSNLYFIIMLITSLTPIWLTIKIIFLYNYINHNIQNSRKSKKNQIKLDSYLKHLDDFHYKKLINKDLDNYLAEMYQQTNPNDKLSIVIPTYNRDSFLDYSLETHIPLAKEFNIPIYVLDNASPDSTKEIVSKWMKRYEFLYYFRNQKNLGGDLNFELALNKPDTDYIWLLGDTYKINKEVLVAVLKQSKFFYDMILLNNDERVKDVETQLISDKEYLLTSLGWNMTQMSSLIYNKKVIKHANYVRFYGTNLLQTGIALEYIAYQENISVKWNKELSIYSLRIEGSREKIGWQKSAFDIWINKWARLVLSLPSIYSLEGKLKTIQMHNQKTQVFSFKNLLKLRSKGFYSMQDYKKYKKYFDISIGDYNKFKFIFIALLPVKLVSFVNSLFKQSS